MSPSTVKRGEATRAAILERGVDLASTEGLEALSIGRLASELEMSKSGVFAHFGSKQELQLAIVGAAAERFVGAVLAPAAAAPEGAARLRAITTAYMDYLEGDVYQGGCFWGAVSSEFDDRPGPVRDAIAAGVEAWTGELERQARSAGVGDPERLAFEIYSIGMGANSRFRLGGDRRVLGVARGSLESLLAELPESVL